MTTPDGSPERIPTDDDTTSRYGGGGCNAMTSTGWTTYGCHCDAGPRPL